MDGVFPSSLGQWWTYLSQTAIDVLRIAGVFACLWLWLHRKNLGGALQTVLPKSLRFNLLILIVDTVLVILPLSYLSTVLQGYLTSAGWVLFAVPLTDWHPVIVIPLALFTGDFVAYFRHRLEHSRLLWPSHVMHHSDQDMHWTTVYRFHPINRVTTVIIDYGSLMLLGFPPYAIAINGMIRSYYGMFIHTNLPWTLGWLGHVLVSPAMHRWHHVLEGDGVGTNFATIFSVFDRTFGTYYVPGPCNQTLGVPDVDNDAFLTQLTLPVTRAVSFLADQAKALTKSVRPAG